MQASMPKRLPLSLKGIKMRDVNLFVSELERTSILFLVSTDKMIDMMFRFSRSCGLGYSLKTCSVYKSRKIREFQRR